MNVTIIGTGSVGTAMAAGLVKAGHAVTLAGRDAGHLEQAAAQTGATAAAELVSAVEPAEVVVLAVPFGAVEAVAAAILPVIAGKVVVDVTNPAKEDWSAPLFGGPDSATAHLAAWLPGAKVVKAFNTIFASNLGAPRGVDGIQLDAYVAGDDAEAKAIVSTLAGDLGFRPVDAGTLPAAALLESLAWLNISLNARGGNWQSGWKLLGLAA